VTYFQNVGKYHYNDTTTNDTSAWSYYNDTEYGPSFLQFTVEISKPAQLAVDLGISNVPIQMDDSTTKTANNGTALLPFHVGENVTISVPQVLPLQNLTRLVFQGWQNGSNSTERSVLLEGNIRVRGFYQPQYLLQVNSVVPAYAQSTWQNPGSSVTLETATSAPMNSPLGALGVHYIFKGWTGDVTSNANKITLSINTPKVVNANFTPDLTTLTLPSILLAGVVGAVSLTIVQRRSVATASPIEMDSEDYETKQGSEKLCASCGKPAKGNWVHCIKCGNILGKTPKSTPSSRSRRRSKR
jgi:hypothetical protein